MRWSRARGVVTTRRGEVCRWAKPWRAAMRSPMTPGVGDARS
jgi:hypothetical protein